MELYQPVTRRRLVVVLGGALTTWGAGSVALLLAARASAADLTAPGLAGLEGQLSTAASLLALVLLSWLTLAFVASVLDLSQPGRTIRATPYAARSHRARAGSTRDRGRLATTATDPGSYAASPPWCSGSRWRRLPPARPRSRYRRRRPRHRRPRHRTSQRPPHRRPIAAAVEPVRCDPRSTSRRRRKTRRGPRTAQPSR